MRLLPNGAQERRLRRIADVCARLWNELNYARLVQYREGGKVDFEGTEHEFYHKYKDRLGVNAGQVINLNNWMWNSYFELSMLVLPKAWRRRFTVKLRRQAFGRTSYWAKGS